MIQNKNIQVLQWYEQHLGVGKNKLNLISICMCEEADCKKKYMVYAGQD